MRCDWPSNRFLRLSIFNQAPHCGGTSLIGCVFLRRLPKAKLTGQALRLILLQIPIHDLWVIIQKSSFLRHFLVLLNLCKNLLQYQIRPYSSCSLPVRHLSFAPFLKDHKTFEFAQDVLPQFLWPLLVSQAKI